MLELAEKVSDLAIRAGEKIMEIHTSGFHVRIKEDNSPVTEADKASNQILMAGLREIAPGIPIMSEEEKHADYAARKNWEKFWCVDPLDGTKEFVKKNGEFAVCVALIEGVYPVLGVIYAPASRELYYGGTGLGAFTAPHQGEPNPISTAPVQDGEPVVAVASRSHPDPRVEDYLKDFNVSEKITVGSALKFCMLAAGRAQLYPRFNPTMEWDTAAGQAILEAAGGSMCFWNKNRFSYNKENLLNPGFLATA